MVLGTPIVLNLIPSGARAVAHVNEIDQGAELQFAIYNGNTAYNVPEGVTATVRGTKGDGFGYTAAAAVTVGSNIITVTLDEQMTAVAGVNNVFELVLANSNGFRAGTSNFILDVERAALNENTVISDSDIAYAEQVLNDLQSVQAVNTQVQQNKAGLAAEIVNRQSADQTLQQNINAEASSRATTDASLQSQINQLVAPSGEAPSAAEVENARIGSDGTVYPTLGDAIRTQNSLLKSALKADELTQNNIIIYDGMNSVAGSPNWPDRSFNKNLIKINGSFSSVYDNFYMQMDRPTQYSTTISAVNTWAKNIPLIADHIYKFSGFLLGGAVTIPDDETLTYSAKDPDNNIVLTCGYNESVIFKSQTSGNFLFYIHAQKNSSFANTVLAYTLVDVTENEVLKDDVSELKENVSKLEENIVPFYNFKNGRFYDIGRSIIDIDNPNVNANYKCIAIPCEEGDRFMPIIYAFGAASRRWGFVTENGKKLTSEDQLSALTPVINTGEIITAPKNAKYLLCNHRIYNNNDELLTFNPVVYKLNKYDAINGICTDIGLLPKIATGWKSQVIAVWDKYIAIYEENTVKISTDYGDNFNYPIDVSNIGAIKHCRFYANGTIAIFTANKAYYSDDYSALNEAELYNNDGSAFSSDTKYNFDVAGESKTRKYLNGVDMCVFGNYTLSTATTREMIWYSIDNGHSYKIAYEFNIAGNYTARHVHEVYYCETEDVFLVLTGDAQVRECRVLGAEYNAENDTWTVSSLSGEDSSRNFKWSYVDVWDGYLYYSHDVAPGSIKRCKFEDIADVSKHEVILSEIPNDVTLAAFGPAGDMIVIQSVFRSLGGKTSKATLSQYQCSRKIYYSSDRKSFSEITIPPIVLNDVTSIPFWYQPVQNHLISGTWWTNQESKLPSIFIDDIVRASGFPKAFLPL